MKPTDPTADYFSGNRAANPVRKIAKFGASRSRYFEHAGRIRVANRSSTTRGRRMSIILDDEESFARFQRRLIHDLPDNQVEDEIARLRYLETGKVIHSGIQFVRMACRAAAKATPDQKQKYRKSLLWWLHGSKLRTDVVN
jgi:hypothetical protein